MAGPADNTNKPSKAVPWNDPAVRSVVFQAVALSAVVYFFYIIFQNHLTNMENRGITTGFAFLANRAGFRILLPSVASDESHTSGPTFVAGFLNPLLIGFLGIVLSTTVGFIMGIARLSSNWIISKLAAVYIETLRNIPLLLQIFFWYLFQFLVSSR